MGIEELKLNIENNILDLNNLLIFNYAGDKYLVKQYYNKISEIKNLEINFIDNIQSLYEISNNLFLEGKLNILDLDEELVLDIDIPVPNTIILCKKINIKSKNKYSNQIINFPTLIDWQIRDYYLTKYKDYNPDIINWIIDRCNNDLFKIDLELSKVIIFEPSASEFRFNKSLEENLFNHLDNLNLFNLLNSIYRKDISGIKNNYKLDDINPMGFLELIYQGFKNIINIQLNPGSTPESCDLKPNQFWAIKKNTGFYNKDQLLKIFTFITGIDKMIKTGELQTDKLIDYMLVNILFI